MTIKHTDFSKEINKTQVSGSVRFINAFESIIKNYAHQCCIYFYSNIVKHY